MFLIKFQTFLMIPDYIMELIKAVFTGIKHLLFYKGTGWDLLLDILFLYDAKRYSIKVLIRNNMLTQKIVMYSSEEACIYISERVIMDNTSFIDFSSDDNLIFWLSSYSGHKCNDSLLFPQNSFQILNYLELPWVLHIELFGLLFFSSDH